MIDLLHAGGEEKFLVVLSRFLSCGCAVTKRGWIFHLQ